MSFAFFKSLPRFQLILSFVGCEHIVPKLLSYDCFVPSCKLRMEHIVPKLIIEDCFVPSSYLCMEHIVPKLMI